MIIIIRSSSIFNALWSVALPQQQTNSRGKDYLEGNCLTRCKVGFNDDYDDDDDNDDDNEDGGCDDDDRCNDYMEEDCLAGHKVCFNFPNNSWISVNF